MLAVCEPIEPMLLTVARIVTSSPSAAPPQGGELLTKFTMLGVPVVPKWWLRSTSLTSSKPRMLVPSSSTGLPVALPRPEYCPGVTVARAM